MKHVIYTIIIFCSLIFGQALAVPTADIQAPESIEQPLSETGKKRYDAFIHATRCMVCQNQSVAESSSMFAQDMKEWLYEAIASGQTDYEIKAALIQRFGDSVFYSPPFQTNTFLLWGLPFVFMLVGAIVVFRVCRHKHEPKKGEDV